MTRVGKPGVQIWSWNVRVSKPNLSHVELYVAKDGKLPRIPTQTLVSDGKATWESYSGPQEYRRFSDNNVGFTFKLVPVLGGVATPELSVTNTVAAAQAEGLLKSIRLDPQVIWNGETSREIRFSYQDVGTSDLVTDEMLVGRDLLIHRYQSFSPKRSLVCKISNLQVNKPMSAASFAFAPGPGMHLAKDVTYNSSPPIQAGMIVPDFIVQSTGGQPIRLSDLQGKVVVLDLWATWCGNCIDGFAVNNALAHELSDRGVVVLAADVGDSKDVFEKWIEKNGQYPWIRFALDPEGINGKGLNDVFKTKIGLPMTIVIGRDGKVAASYSGRESDSDKRLRSDVEAIAGHS